ncbi:hypothetical protein GOODEAATRI_025599 [Goodea atripinnis]|uniref:Uncharacterized protein n=1 Tax=Goodea atripinnis TaxID=208336 RepID=A0ABV0NN64_9TELE
MLHGKSGGQDLLMCKFKRDHSNDNIRPRNEVRRMPLVAASRYIGPATSEVEKECEHQQICAPDVSACHAESKHPADGQLRTGWPHRLPSRETAGKGKRGVWGGEVGAGGEELREVAGEGEGFMLREPSQKQVTLRTRVAWQAGCGGDRGKETTVRELEEEEKYMGQRRGRDSERGLGLIVSPLSHLYVASKGAPAASANFRLARTCELLGAN